MTNLNLTVTPITSYGKRTKFLEQLISEELGEKYIKYRRNWVKTSERKLITEFPLYIQIEHVGRCNLRCPTCIQGIESLRKKYIPVCKPLEIELYKKILDEAKKFKCPSIAFHNNDEPLLLNDLETRIQMAKRAGFLDIILTTNATLLSEERTHKLLMSGITKINFSVDAFNEEDYKIRRRSGDFTTVLKNIDYFINQKKLLKLKLPTVRITCLLTKYSIKDLSKFREFWNKKVDIVEFQNFQAIKGYTEEFRPYKSKIKDNFVCSSPWQQLVIRANGDVLPCCSFYGTEMVIGNIRKDKLYDIWNGGRIKKIRRELLNNNFSFFPACEKCVSTFYVIFPRKSGHNEELVLA